jgi:hypothetical protein
MEIDIRIDAHIANHNRIERFLRHHVPRDLAASLHLHRTAFRPFRRIAVVA